MKKNDFICNINLSYFGFLLLIIGTICLIDRIGIINNAWGKLWPLILVTIGVVKVLKATYDCPKK